MVLDCLVKFWSAKTTDLSSEHLLHLLVGNGGVVLGDALLVLREVIIGALVGLSVTVLGAEDKTAFAGDFNHANFLATVPAFIRVLLDFRLLLGCSFFDWGRGYDCRGGLVRDDRVNLHWLGLFNFELLRGSRLRANEVSCWLHWHWQLGRLSHGY